MRRVASLLLLVSGVGLALWGENPPGQAPVVAPAKLAPYPGPPADNSRCLVCHANYEEEKLTAAHLKGNVGCVRCHGESEPHSTDEDNLTAPDRLFHKGKIRLLCLTCHDWVKLVESDKQKTDLKEKPDHKAVLEGAVKEKKLCTDCHGEHRLSHRTRIWDRRTGKLMFRDGTPKMISTDPPLPK
jgi:hypothetical protein